MIRRPPRSTLFPTRRSSDLARHDLRRAAEGHDPSRRLEQGPRDRREDHPRHQDRKSTRLNSSHANISYAVFCLKKKRPKTPLTHAHPTSEQSHYYHISLRVP